MTLEEPDIVLKDGNGTVGIAAKRLHSLANLTNNLKKGAQQIEKAGLRGLVALDVSLVAGQNRRLYCDDAAGAITTPQWLVDRFRKDHDTEIKRACRGPHIMGCLVTLNMPVAFRLEGGYVPTTAAARWTAIHLSQSLSDYYWITDFAARCERALFGPRAPVPIANAPKVPMMQLSLGLVSAP